MKTIEKAKLSSNVSAQTEQTSLYDIELNDLQGNPMSLSKFKGKKLLFVNVASKCGFTKQYKELQELSDTYKDQLVIIGSPCNQFGRQEPGDASQIQEFCAINFGVTFPLTEKLDVKGKNQHPLYTWLTSKKLNGQKRSNVKWNFQKYLVDENGQLINYYYSFTKPMSTKITKHL
ncbi:glutathione peroxidase [Kordia sp.]|uniref:glutathione peroxidase n=1 Tax=Kordia sp. TaxID=1965332 RepID=UPI0025BC1263|nr:glutathione peroxidase [Kordia sp.]MCH2194063.1 glutathione peroxidase [Kordia sp.]